MLVASIFWLVAVSCFGQEPLSFKGLQLGVAAKDELLKLYPDATCPGSGDLCWFIWEQAMRDDSHERLMRRRPDTSEARQEALARFNQQASVAGARATEIYFSLHDGRLHNVRATPPSSSWSIVSQAFIDRYGKPLIDESSVIQTRAGVKYENRKLVWLVGGGQIAVERYSGDVTKSSLAWMTDAHMARLKERGEQSRAKAAKDL